MVVAWSFESLFSSSACAATGSEISMIGSPSSFTSWTVGEWEGCGRGGKKVCVMNFLFFIRSDKNVPHPFRYGDVQSLWLRLRRLFL